MEATARELAHPLCVERRDTQRQKRVAHVVILLAQTQLATVTITNDQHAAALRAGQTEVARPPTLGLRRPLARAVCAPFLCLRRRSYSATADPECEATSCASTTATTTASKGGRRRC